MTKAFFNKIQIVQGDITKQEVEAVVNAANTSLLGGGGVDGAIHRAAGPRLLEECKTIGGCPTGEARITKGYNLYAKYVIHTVGPVYQGTTRDEKLLSSCYQNCFKLAGEYNITSMAFPAISCGVYGYPIGAACKIAVDTSLAALEGLKRLEQIIFVLFSSHDYQVYQDYLSRITHPHI